MEQHGIYFNANVIYRFCYLHGCGCVMSESAITEVKSNLCLACGTPYEKDDVIQVYPDRPEDIERLKQRIERINIQRKNDRKTRKMKRSDGEGKSEKKIKIEKEKIEKVNSKMILPKLADLMKHKTIDSDAVQGIYITEPILMTNPLFSGTFSRRN